MDYLIKLDVFEGPLDLLLYLIRKNEIDIYDIPISLITGQYIGYIDAMKSLNLDLAGEYLVLAATLLHIKSRMLLPVHEEPGTEEEDPRAELVRQLLEYQSFKEAALDLNRRKLLDRDTFTRTEPFEDESEPSGGAIREVGVFELVKAFQRVMAGLSMAEFSLDINADTMSLSQRITEVLDLLTERKSLTFDELLEVDDRRVLVYTFLALLELMKMRVARAFQQGPYESIRIWLAVELEGGSET